jgi:trans-aconitate methyltransferase
MTPHSADFYPAMSHPPAHPSLMAATALLGGVRLAPSHEWHILEIGCASGHHILPIAQAYPQARITAIDLDANAITEARRLAHLAKISNIEFLCADLTTWQPTAQHYDLIIAHGVFSWVDDRAKSALLALCRHALKTQGVAMISYNTQPGWSLRQPLREMTMALQSVHPSAEQALHWLEKSLTSRNDAYAHYLREIIQDTRAKGEQQLKFDDLAPVNDPCYFSQFIHWCEQSGLTYLGETDCTLANTELLDASAQQSLRELSGHPLLFEQMSDFLTGRTFRCSLIARSDVSRRIPTPDELAALSLEALMPIPSTGHPATDALTNAITQAEPNCLPLHDLLVSTPHLSIADAIPLTLRLQHLGMLRLRHSPISIAAETPSHPRLSPLNLDHLAQGKPIVDAFHRPCQLSANDRNWLRLCDGTISFEQLMKACRDDTQRHALHELLAHLHQRGLFLP